MPCSLAKISYMKFVGEGHAGTVLWKKSGFVDIDPGLLTSGNWCEGRMLVNKSTPEWPVHMVWKDQALTILAYWAELGRRGVCQQSNSSAFQCRSTGCA